MKAKRKRQSEASIAATADVWEDREGKARPTPERRAKGQFRLIDGDDAGVTVAVDQCATMLDWLSARHRITPEQHAAGIMLTGLLDRTRLGSRGRSCLDFSPVGHDGDEISEQAIRDEQERADVYLGVGMASWAELRRVCQDHEKPRDIAKLHIGLDFCATYWGIVDKRR